MRKIFIFLLFILLLNNVNADIMTELAKRDIKNPIYLIEERSPYILHTRNDQFFTDYIDDDYSIPSIVAYNINEDNIKLIIRIRTWDFAFRMIDSPYRRNGVDQFIVDVHDYYLVELVYVNEKLETYCNRIMDININGFIFNEAKINNNIDEANKSYHYPTYPPLKIELEEGMKVKIAGFTNERTDEMRENSYSFKTYDYYYNVLINEEQVRINGYLLDFGRKIEYRSKLLILKSGNTPQEVMPQEASDYLGTWRYTGTGGMGFDEYRRTITIKISENEFHYHFKGHTIEHEYSLANITWTRIIRPDEDFHSYVEMFDDYFKGASGYLVTGTLINKTGNWSPDTDIITEYIYLRPDNKDMMFWYNFSVSNYILRRQ